jgi:hypothetical protein
MNEGGARSDFGGDGRRRPHPLLDSYNPPGDKEGATWNGLLPRKRTPRKDDR